jgi:predicted HD phosphohydrolase
MDEGSTDDYAVIRRDIAERQREMPRRIRAMLCQLEVIYDGFGVNQLVHCLQTATRARRAGANDELVAAALCHDVAKVVSFANHAAIIAEIMKPYVGPDTYEILPTHEEFQWKHAIGAGNVDARLTYQRAPWYATACLFSDEWDQTSFDPSYDTMPLDAFDELIARTFAQPR